MSLDWTYVVNPTLELYRMSWPKLIQSVRTALINAKKKAEAAEKANFVKNPRKTSPKGFPCKTSPKGFPWSPSPSSVRSSSDAAEHVMNLLREALPEDLWREDLANVIMTSNTLRPKLDGLKDADSSAPPSEEKKSSKTSPVSSQKIKPPLSYGAPHTDVPEVDAPRAEHAPRKGLRTPSSERTHIDNNVADIISDLKSSTADIHEVVDGPEVSIARIA